MKNIFQDTKNLKNKHQLERNCRTGRSRLLNGRLKNNNKNQDSFKVNWIAVLRGFILEN